MLAFLGVCLMLFVQLGDAIHKDAVPHTQCAAHGEWVHAEGDEGATAVEETLAAATQYASKTQRARSHDRVQAQDLHLHGHHHCTFCLASREQSLELSVFASLLVELQPTAPAFEWAATGVSSQAKPLTNAPKTSPPRHLS
jgi:hypothetical protein